MDYDDVTMEDALFPWLADDCMADLTTGAWDGEEPQDEQDGEELQDEQDGMEVTL